MFPSADVSPEDPPAAFADALPVERSAMSRRRGRASPMIPARGRHRLDSPSGRRRSAPDARARSSPTPSPRACSTAPASGIRAIPNFSPSSRQAAAHAAAGDDAVVARPRRRAGDDPFSLREAIRSSHATIVRHGPHRRCGPEARFGIANPRLAVSGLNPHAGEDGSLGLEDIDIVAPAVAILRARHRCARTAAGGHDVSRRRPQDL